MEERMLDPRPVPEVDQWLTELDKSLESPTPSPVLYQRWFAELSQLLDAESVALLMPDSAGRWTSLFASGEFQDEISTLASDDPIASLPADLSRLVIPIHQADPQRGLIVTQLEPNVSTSTSLMAQEILAGFAEIIAARQQVERDRFYEIDWPNFQGQLSLQASQGPAHDRQLIVNRLQGILHADRVSLVHLDEDHRSYLVAVSHTLEIDRHGEGARQIVACAENSRSKTDEASVVKGLQESQSENNHNMQVIRLQSYLAAEDCYVVEWPDEATRLLNTWKLTAIVPTLEMLFLYQRRWEAVPVRLQEQIVAKLRRRPWWRSLTRAGVRLLAIASMIVALVWPIPLRLELTGTLQPVEQRFVFSSVDGTVDEILIEDSDDVTMDQPLIRMLSPNLERQVEQIQGELLSLIEKRSALNISLNQVSNEGKDVEASLAGQARISADLKLLEVEEASLREQTRLAQAEQAKLIIRAPIAGKVLAHDVKKYLDRRPIRRGDPLFRIADHRGDWQLNLQVADRDSHYLSQTFQNTSAPTLVDFSYASNPRQHFSATLQSIAPFAYRDASLGVVVDVKATVDSSVASHGQLGGAVTAHVTCGKWPVVFVWCRPLIESLQRRFWW
jgi:multidrug efflux pump subunit AcrA (membrane-fusion protein)